jgi:hypothetical protein
MSAVGKVTFAMIAEGTRRALERRGDVIAKALLFANDTKKEERLKEMLCPGCAYGGGYLAGQALTRWNCFACGKEGMHHNTAVPRLCLECAKELALCCRCLADINLEIRRRVRIRKGEAKRKTTVRRR